MAGKCAGMATSRGGFSTVRRNELARARGFRSYAEQRRFRRTVAGRADLASLPPGAQEARQAALDAVAVARREGISLADAARREHVPLSAVSWYASDAVSRRDGGWHVSAADRMYRPMTMWSGGELVPVDVRGSRAASLVGKHHAAIQQFLSTGDASALQALAGKRVDGMPLDTDPALFEELARMGELDFESIYRMVDA
jgi:hypothetical protein